MEEEEEGEEEMARWSIDSQAQPRDLTGHMGNWNLGFGFQWHDD